MSPSFLRRLSSIHCHFVLFSLFLGTFSYLFVLCSVSEKAVFRFLYSTFHHVLLAVIKIVINSKGWSLTVSNLALMIAISDFLGQCTVLPLVFDNTTYCISCFWALSNTGKTFLSFVHFYYNLPMFSIIYGYNECSNCFSWCKVQALHFAHKKIR